MINWDKWEIADIDDVVDCINSTVDWDDEDYKLLYKQMLSEVKSVKSMDNGDLVDFGDFQILLKRKKEVKDGLEE